MTAAEKLYISVAEQLKDATPSQMFGKPCFKVNGKAFVCFFKDEMVFKLTADVHLEALSLAGAQLFDPSGKKRAMKEWVQVPFEHKKKWAKYAKAAIEYVGQE